MIGHQGDSKDSQSLCYGTAQIAPILKARDVARATPSVSVGGRSWHGSVLEINTILSLYLSVWADCLQLASTTINRETARVVIFHSVKK